MVNLHNGVLLRCLKKQHYEIYRQINRTRKWDPELGKSELEDKHDMYSLIIWY